MLNLTDIDQKTVVIRQVVFLLFFLSFRQQFEYFFLPKRVKCSAGGERQEKAFKLNSFCYVIFIHLLHLRFVSW